MSKLKRAGTERVFASSRLIFFYTLRSLIRQIRSSFSALFTIAAGVAALLLADGYSAAMFSEFRDSAIRAEFGHLQVTLPGFHERGRSSLNTFVIDALPEELRSGLPDGSMVAPRFLFTGLVSAGDTTMPFNAIGMEPDSDAQGGNALVMIDGSRLRGGKQELLLGRGLARKLAVSAGDTVVLLVTTMDDQLNASEFYVSGVVSSSSDAVDDTLVIVPIAAANDLMHSQGAHQYLVFLPSAEDTGRVLDALTPAAQAAGLELRDWLSLAEFYRRAEALFSQQLGVVRTLVAVILLLSISNTMMMSVMERTREIGTSMAIGAAPSRIMTGFLLEGAMLGFLGACVGVFVAVMLALLLSALQIEMPPPPGFSVGYIAAVEFSAGALIQVVTLAVVATVTATLYPAWRASRLQIVDALRVVR